MSDVDMDDCRRQLKDILTPELLLTIYRLKFPFERQGNYSGTDVGVFHFRPSDQWMQSFYDVVFHPALLPMSEIPISTLLEIDLTEFLPKQTAPDFPEQCLGLITLLDQTRTITAGYGFRYTRSFFDPVCEKLARQLIALPTSTRPDGKQAWLSRGYSFNDWLIRTLWIWAPMIHSDTYMVTDRQMLKQWLHLVRAETERECGETDPFAALEPADDADLMAYKQIMTSGPPSKSYEDATSDATVTDYTFWWIRIFNAHFAVTDMCGHFPSWTRWKGLELTEDDQEFMEKTQGWLYNPDDEPVLEQIRRDRQDGVWQPFPVNFEFERSDLSSPEMKSAKLPKMLSERTHGRAVACFGEAVETS